MLGLGLSLGVLAVRRTSAGPVPVLPGDIADLTATAQSDTEVLLEFTPATDATSHEYRIDGGSAVECDDNTGTQTVDGLTAETEYDFEVRGVNGDGSGDWSNIATETTDASPDVTAPTLSNPVDNASGATGAAISVDTNEGNGTLYWFVSTSATPPSAADLKAGTGATAAGNQAVSGTGTQNATPTGLTETTLYWAHFLHRDTAGNDSAIATGNGFKAGRGPELIVGGDFSNAGDWTANATASVSAGVGNLNGNGATTPTLSQAVAFEAGATYEIIHDVTEVTAGQVRPALIGGTGVNGTGSGTTGTKTQQLTALSGNVTFRLQGTNSSAVAKVDNASVRKVL